MAQTNLDHFKKNYAYYIKLPRLAGYMTESLQNYLKTEQLLVRYSDETGIRELGIQIPTVV